MIFNIKPFLIETAAHILLPDSQIFADAKEFTKNIDEKPLSNDEKHAKVKHDLLTIFGDFGTTLMDIAIKLAVLWLRSQKSD